MGSISSRNKKWPAKNISPKRAVCSDLGTAPKKGSWQGAFCHGIFVAAQNCEFLCGNTGIWKYWVVYGVLLHFHAFQGQGMPDNPQVQDWDSIVLQGPKTLLRCDLWQTLLFSLAYSKFHFDTFDGRNPAPPGMVLKPCKFWDKLPTSTGDRRIYEPSTVALKESLTANVLNPNWVSNLQIFNSASTHIRFTKATTSWVWVQNSPRTSRPGFFTKATHSRWSFLGQKKSCNVFLVSKSKNHRWMWISCSLKVSKTSFVMLCYCSFHGISRQHGWVQESKEYIQDGLLPVISRVIIPLIGVK